MRFAQALLPPLALFHLAIFGTGAIPVFDLNLLPDEVVTAAAHHFEAPSVAHGPPSGLQKTHKDASLESSTIHSGQLHPGGTPVQQPALGTHPIGSSAQTIARYAAHVDAWQPVVKGRFVRPSKFDAPPDAFSGAELRRWRFYQRRKAAREADPTFREASKVTPEAALKRLATWPQAGVHWQTRYALLEKDPEKFHRVRLNGWKDPEKPDHSYLPLGWKKDKAAAKKGAAQGGSHQGSSSMLSPPVATPRMQPPFKMDLNDGPATRRYAQTRLSVYDRYQAAVKDWTPTRYTGRAFRHLAHTDETSGKAMISPEAALHVVANGFGSKQRTWSKRKQLFEQDSELFHHLRQSGWKGERQIYDARGIKWQAATRGSASASGGAGQSEAGGTAHQ